MESDPASRIRPFARETGVRAAITTQPIAMKVNERTSKLIDTLCRRLYPFFLFRLVVDGVPLREHPLMQDAGNENSSRLAPEEHDMLALFHAAQAGANVIAGAARRRIVGQ
jgi:hypothetical protein